MRELQKLRPEENNNGNIDYFRLLDLRKVTISKLLKSRQ